MRPRRWRFLASWAALTPLHASLFFFPLTLQATSQLWCADERGETSPGALGEFHIKQRHARKRLWGGRADLALELS